MTPAPRVHTFNLAPTAFQKRKGNNQRGGYGGMKRHGGPAGPAPGGAKKSKGPEDDGTPKPAYSVIQATNPISALYEYCRKSKC